MSLSCTALQSESTHFSTFHWVIPQCRCFWAGWRGAGVGGWGGARGLGRGLGYQLLPPQQPKGACEHLSQITFFLLSEPSMTPTTLRGKNQSPPFGPQGPARPVPSPPCPHLLHAPLHSLCAPATRASSLFLQHPQHASFISGLCTGYLLCLECPSTSFKSLLKCHCFRRIP